MVSRIFATQSRSSRPTAPNKFEVVAILSRNPTINLPYLPPNLLKSYEPTDENDPIKRHLYRLVFHFPIIHYNNDITTDLLNATSYDLIFTITSWKKFMINMIPIEIDKLNKKFLDFETFVKFRGCRIENYNFKFYSFPSDSPNTFSFSCTAFEVKDWFRNYVLDPILENVISVLKIKLIVDEDRKLSRTHIIQSYISPKITISNSYGHKQFVIETITPCLYKFIFNGRLKHFAELDTLHSTLLNLIYLRVIDLLYKMSAKYVFLTDGFISIIFKLVKMNDYEKIPSKYHIVSSSTTGMTTQKVLTIYLFKNFTKEQDFYKIDQLRKCYTRTDSKQALYQYIVDYFEAEPINDEISKKFASTLSYFRFNSNDSLQWSRLANCYRIASYTLLNYPHELFEVPGDFLGELFPSVKELLDPRQAYYLKLWDIDLFSEHFIYNYEHYKDLGINIFFDLFKQEMNHIKYETYFDDGELIKSFGMMIRHHELNKTIEFCGVFMIYSGSTLKHLGLQNT